MNKKICLLRKELILVMAWTLFQSPTIIAQPSGGDPRFGFVGGGAQQFAHKFKTGSYVTIGNHDNSGQIQNLTLAATSNEWYFDEIVRRVATLDARKDGLGQTVNAFESGIKKWSEELYIWYNINKPDKIWNWLSGGEPKPTYTWWKPNVAKLIAADSAQLEAAIRRDMAWSRADRITYEIGNEPNLFPYIDPIDYADLYMAYARFIRKINPDAKLALGAYFMMEMFPDNASKNKVIDLFEQKSHRQVNDNDYLGLLNTFGQNLLNTDHVISTVVGNIQAKLFKYTTLDYHREVLNRISKQPEFTPTNLSVHIYPADVGDGTIISDNWFIPKAMDASEKMVLLTSRAFPAIKKGEPKILITEWGNINYKLTEKQVETRTFIMGNQLKDYDYWHEMKWFYYKPVGVDAKAAALLPGQPAPFSRMISNINYNFPLVPQTLGEDPFPCRNLNNLGIIYYRLANNNKDCSDWRSWGADPIPRKFIYGTSQQHFPDLNTGVRPIIADFDNDGDPDILYQGSAGDGKSYRYAVNNGVNGGFKDVAINSSPFAGLTIPDNTYSNGYIADFDNDGNVDLWFPEDSYNGFRTFYFSNNGVRFTSQSTPKFPRLDDANSAIVGDFDVDGDVDILYQKGGSYRYARNKGNATFDDMEVGSSPFAGLRIPNIKKDLGDGYKVINYYLADFDGDGDIDLWFAGSEYDTDNNKRYFRNDRGKFVDASNNVNFPNINKAIVGDFDSDGDVDILYQAWNYEKSYLYARNNGKMNFTELSTSDPLCPFAGLKLPDAWFPMSLHQGYTKVQGYYTNDFDGDGDLDIWFQRTVNESSAYSVQNGQSPYLTFSTPANKAINVARNANIVLNFSKGVIPGDGNVYICRASDRTVVERIAANSTLVTGNPKFTTHPQTGAQVTTGSTTITINPKTDLTPNTSYFITFDLTAFKDIDGRNFGKYDAWGKVFGPITSSNFLGFTTGTAIL